MNQKWPGLVAREAQVSAAVLKARAAGSDPYALVFTGSGRRSGLVDPVDREYPAWTLFADEARPPEPINRCASSARSARVPTAVATGS